MFFDIINIMQAGEKLQQELHFQIINCENSISKNMIYLQREHTFYLKIYSGISSKLKSSPDSKHGPHEPFSGRC